jgi:D-lyxose ketol-isomerase
MPVEGQHITDKFDRPEHPHLWGSEEWIVNNDRYCGKILYLEPGSLSSLHFHPVKDETFLCIKGMVGVQIFRDGKEVIHVLRGWARDAVNLEHNTPHRFWAMESDAVVVEFSSYHSDADVVRLEESRKILEGELYISKEEKTCTTLS